jgi:HPt (histidine-containing phosphotransfer) domain-containing protein
MDTQMPGLSGPPLVKELRAHSPASIFAISAGEPPSELVEVVDGFLMKPFNPDSLQALLEKSSPVPAVEEDVERPVVKPEILAQLRGMMNEAAVREIYSAIVSDLDRRIIALRTALGKEDVEEIRRIGHSIKGGCGMAGALQAAHLGARLEVESNHLDNGKVILDQLHSAARNLESMLKAEFPS